MELGKKIRTLRLKAGFTQEQLAEKLGIGPQAVSKWENAAAMPDVAALPVLAEVFGVTVDDLFDLTVEQRFRRIENRMDIEEDLPQDVFLEYEEFLKERAGEEPYEKRATELLAYLYWHKMNAFSRKAGRYARDAVRRAPGEKTCYWMLAQAERHAVWDWNVSNHHKAIGFYREIVESDPGVKLPYLYLLDNLLADHRAEEAEAVLARYAALPDVNPVHVGIYRAYIALARFDEPAADRIVEELEKEHPDDFGCLFESAQYYARKCDYDRAIALYERSFEREPRRPRFQDELMAIADIHEIRGDFRKAAAVYERIVDLLRNEWGMTEETELKDAEKERDRLLAKA